MKQIAMSFVLASLVGISGARAQDSSKSSPEAGAVCADQALDSSAVFIAQIRARVQAQSEAVKTAPARLVKADDNGWQNIGGGCWQKQDPDMPPGCYKNCCPYPVETTYPCLQWGDGGCGHVGCRVCVQFDYQHPQTSQQPGLTCSPTC